jgi:hypothetical protein
MDDASCKSVFELIIRNLVEVLPQCGGGSLTGDRLGSLNLTIQGLPQQFWDSAPPAGALLDI